MKSALVILTFLAIVGCLYAQSHNVSWGGRSAGDLHLKHAVVFKKSGFLRKQTQDFEFDLKDTPHVRSITQVVVTDQYTNGKGGYATLSAGGPNSNFVKIRLASQRGRGFNFIIDIYGR